MTERTYTYAEMLANQAAALREAAEAIADVPYAATTKEYVKAILALTTDQLALDRHDAELRIDTMIWCTGAMSLNERDNAVIQKAIKEEEAKRDRLQQDHR